MNRLTARSKNREAYYPVCVEACDGDLQDCGNCDIYKDICDRLAAYEDTGLEPEEIPHWIPVSERLPEELGHYLAVVKRIAPDEFGGNGTRIRIMRWLGDDWRYAHHIPEWINQKITETVTHWMYLPKLPEEPAITHNEESRSCENCGNIQCANSPIAYHWDECVDTNFTKHWIPKPPKE